MPSVPVMLERPELNYIVVGLPLPNTTDGLEELFESLSKIDLNRSGFFQQEGIGITGLDAQFVWQFVRQNTQYRSEFDAHLKKMKDPDKYYPGMYEPAEKMAVEFASSWMMSACVDYRERELPNDVYFKNLTVLKLSLPADLRAINPFLIAFATVVPLQNASAGLIKERILPICLVVNPTVNRKKILADISEILDAIPFAVRDPRSASAKENIKVNKNRRSHGQYEGVAYPGIRASHLPKVKYALVAFYLTEYRKLEFVPELQAEYQRLCGAELKRKQDLVDHVNRFRDLADGAPWNFFLPLK